MPKPVQRTGPALALALLAHLLLIAALAFGVNWHTDEPTTIAAELWSATPQAAAPRAVEPPPPPPTPVAKPPPPTPKPEAAPPPTPTLPDPQIAIEKAKREQAKKQADEDARQLKAQQLAEQKAEQAQRDKAEAAQKKAEADKAAKDAAKEKAQAEKAEAAKQAAAREAQLKRIAGLAGATGGATDTGSALRSSAPSAGYAGRIAAYIKPKITLLDTVDGNPRAVVEIRLASDGTIIGRRLVTSSGAKAWDDAVLRAVDSAGQVPRDTDGRVPSVMVIGFRPQD
jgi:colicin import membrane protein